MKKSITLLIVCLLLPAGLLSAQTFSDFQNYVRYEGGELMAKLAHPFNKFSYAESDIQDGGIRIYIKYEEGYETLLKFYLGDESFNRVEVVRDTDWATPFLATAVMKETAYLCLREVASETVASIEGEIGTRFRDMTGKQMSCLLLTVGWLRYINGRR